MPIADVDTARASAMPLRVQRARGLASDVLAGRVPGAPFELAQPVLFALIGASSTVIDVSLFWLLTHRGHLVPLVANAVSSGIAAGNSYDLSGNVTIGSVQVSLNSPLALSPRARPWRPLPRNVESQ